MMYDKFMELLWNLYGSRAFLLDFTMSDLYYTDIVSIIKREIKNRLKIRMPTTFKY